MRHSERKEAGRIKTLLRNGWHLWERLLAPPVHLCRVCGQKTARSPESLQLCSRCFGRIDWIRSIRCDRCGRPEDCPDCRRRKPEHAYFVRNRSAVRYTAEMRQWLAMYKYRGDEKLAEVLGGMLSAPYQRLLNEERSRRPQFVFDAVTYIPLSRERQEERGFNQAEQMARCLGEKHSLPVVSLLRRTKDTEKLSCQTRTDRFRTMAAAFAIDPAGAAALRGESKLNLLLVDDVYTTGSTLNSAAKTIASELNARIYGLTWAR